MASFLASPIAAPRAAGIRSARAGRSVRAVVIAKAQNAPRPSQNKDAFSMNPPRGACDIKEAADAKEACKGLEGEDLEACWATFGCDLEATTKHYARIAGVAVPEKKQ